MARRRLDMHHLKQIITVFVLSLSMNVFAEDVSIDTDYYVSDLSCEAEVIAIEKEGLEEVTKYGTIELPEYVVTCKIDDSIMVSLNAK